MSRSRRIGSRFRLRTGAIALAVILAAACAGPSLRPSTSDAAIPPSAADSVRLRPLVQQAVEARVLADPYWREARGQVGEHMRMRIIPSGAVPGLSYGWGFFVPPGIMHRGAFAGAVGTLRDSTRILEDAEDWASLVGPAWAPRGPDEALAACVEVTWFLPAWAATDPVYVDTASAVFDITWSYQVEEMKRRLTNPSVERTGDGGWEVGYWIVHPGHSVRHRCTLRPGAPAAAAIRIVPLDTARVGTIAL